jgi:hypothetical protein
MNESNDARIERLEKRIAQLESTLTNEVSSIDGRLNRAAALMGEQIENLSNTHMLAFHAFYDWRPEGYKGMTIEEVRAWEIADRKAKRLAREQREKK